MCCRRYRYLNKSQLEGLTLTYTVANLGDGETHENSDLLNLGAFTKRRITSKRGPGKLRVIYHM